MTPAQGARCEPCAAIYLLAEEIMYDLDVHDWRLIERLAIKIAKVANEQQLLPDATAPPKEAGIS